MQGGHYTRLAERKNKMNTERKQNYEEAITALHEAIHAVLAIGGFINEAAELCVINNRIAKEYSKESGEK